MEQMQAYRMLWQERKDGGARLLRMYGTSPRAVVPSQIAGHSLVEIAPYCFAQKVHLPKEGYLEELCLGDGEWEPALQELCAASVKEIFLPDSVREIGNCAFYNCKNLETLFMGAGVCEIGSDAFMNTLSFHQIILRCPADKKSGIRQILIQISAEMEVRFETEAGTEAVLLYPEYYESYDEIAPAHLFGRSITGEGFRARQCIKDGRVDFMGYDAIFLQACVEESEITLEKMAINRLKYPYGLNGKNKQIYQNYLLAHGKTLGIRLTKKRDLETLQFLCREKLLHGGNLAECIQTAADIGWPEGAASLLQQQAASGKKRRYDFDAFE